MKTFVIAGNYTQGMEWVKKDISMQVTNNGGWRSISDYIIVKDVTSLKGYSNPHGCFVGTWRERTDLKDILVHLHIQSLPANQKILHLMKEIGV